MAIEKVEFSFPDPEENFEIEVEGNSSQFTDEPKEEPKVKETKRQEEDLEVEIVDDTPAKDRNRKPSDPPEEATDEELENYSEKVRKRIQHLSKGYHDERRAKEQALRERQELEAYAQRIVEENKNLKGNFSKSQEALLEQAKRVAETEFEQAKAKYKEAYESGDADKVLEAQEELTNAKFKVEKVKNFKPAPLQDEQTSVQTQTTAPQSSYDAKAEAWRQENAWFGSDDEMTSFALGLHQKLVKSGVDPRSDEYYDAINKRMRQVFPENFGDAEETVEPRQERKSNVVAPATRSVAPKKITLTKTQVALAKRLGVPLTEYAKQVAEEMRKQS
jgi:hypothetical protein